MQHHSASFRVQLPTGREDEFAEWVYEDPRRCPGLRFHHETYRALMQDYRYIPETGDFSDLAHVAAVPYVEAATLDRRMRHYCGIASQRLSGLGFETNYGARIHQDLGSLMQP